MAEPTVAAAFVEAALAAVPPAGRAAVLAKAGLRHWKAGERVPAPAFAGLWMVLAELLDDEFFALDRRRMKVGSFAMICHAVAAQPTVRHGMSMAVRAFNVLLDDIRLEERGGGGRWQLLLRHRQRTARSRFAEETLLVMLHGLLCWMAGRRVQPQRLDWAGPKPPHADEYLRMFGPAQQHDAAVTLFEVDPGVLAVPLRIGRAQLKSFLRDAPQSVFLKQVGATAWAERARRAALAALREPGTPLPTLAQLAAQLGVSEPTLRRRLAAEGMGWQRLKSALRRDLALKWLADPRGPSVAEVAHRLGYQDPGTLHRACRRWTGMAPGAWRRDAASAGAEAPL